MYSTYINRCEGKETRQKFRMEPGMKLFPAVFVKATSKDALQYELGRTSTRDGNRSLRELVTLTYFNICHPTVKLHLRATILFLRQCN